MLTKFPASHLKPWLITLGLSSVLVACSSSDNVQVHSPDDGSTEACDTAGVVAQPDRVDTLSANSARATTETIIVAPLELVWQDLLDADAMSRWSSSFLGFSGSVNDNGRADIRYQANGRVQQINRKLSYQRASSIAWSGSLSEYDGVQEERRFVLEAASNCLTRLVQQNTFTGSSDGLDANQIAAQALQRYAQFNAEMKAYVEGLYADIQSCTPNLSIDVPQGNVRVQSGERATVETSTIINVPRYQAWQTFIDFEKMPTWSSTLQSIEGNLCNCAQVTVNEKDATGQLFSYQRQIQESIDGQLLGWSESTGPSNAEPFGGFTDNRRFAFESINACQTRFSHSNGFVGDGNPSYNAQGMASYFLPLYQNFNREFKAQAER